MAEEVIEWLESHEGEVWSQSVHQRLRAYHWAWIKEDREEEMGTNAASWPDPGMWYQL